MSGIQVRFSKPNPIVAVAFLVKGVIYEGSPTDTHASLLLVLNDTLKDIIIRDIYSADSLDKPPSKDVQDGFVTDAGNFLQRDLAYKMYK